MYHMYNEITFYNFQKTPPPKKKIHLYFYELFAPRGIRTTDFNINILNPLEPIWDTDLYSILLCILEYRCIELRGIRSQSMMKIPYFESFPIKYW
jgi:hypothetical protein